MVHKFGSLVLWFYLDFSNLVLICLLNEILSKNAMIGWTFSVKLSMSLRCLLTWVLTECLLLNRAFPCPENT